MTLFDTDVVIDAIRGEPGAIRRLERSEAEGLAVSAISRMELLVGCRDRPEVVLLNGFLTRFETVHLSERVSARGILLVETYRLSHGLRMPDALIAATALVTELPLVSKNQRDFRFIDGLRLEPYPV